MTSENVTKEKTPDRKHFLSGVFSYDGTYRSRTCDLLRVRQALSQLS